MDERRSEQRFLCADLVTVEVENQQRRLTVNLEDISPSGVCLGTGQPLPADATLLLRCSSCQLRGKVRYCIFREDGYQVGLRLLNCRWSKQQYCPEHLLDSPPLGANDLSLLMQGDTQASRLLADILTTSSHDRRTACPPVRWTPLVERIRAGDEGATRELYSILLKELRLSIWRQLSGRDVNDHIHDIFIVVLRALRGGLLRDTESLIAFIRGVARNHIASYICQAGLHRRRDADGANPQWAAPSPESPEKILLGREKVEIAGQALNRLRPRDREILRRFYVLEQPVTQICQEMRLGATQFRLAKSRAKSLFGEIGRRIMQRRSPGKSAAGAGIAAAGAESNIASE